MDASGRDDDDDATTDDAVRLRNGDGRGDERNKQMHDDGMLQTGNGRKECPRKKHYGERRRFAIERKSDGDIETGGGTGGVCETTIRSAVRIRRRSYPPRRR